MITKSKHVEAVIRKHWRELIRGGVEKTDVFMDKTKAPPPTALCARTHQCQRQRAGQPHIILSRQPLLRMRHHHTIQQPRNMDSRDTIKLTNLIQDGKYYDLRHAIYWPKGCAPALTAAMGMGGGFVPLLVVIK